jgi:hypothetical protein
MAIYKRIKELEAKIKHLESEPAQHWFGKLAKSVKVHTLEKKVASLKKQLKPKFKTHKLDPNVE